MLKSLFFFWKLVPVTGPYILKNMQSAARFLCRVFALLSLVAAVWGVPKKPSVALGSLWVRLELVENSTEGPAFDRCELEETLKARNVLRSRVFFGEAQVDAANSWKAIRPQSGCGVVKSDGAPNPWTLRGSPYLLVDVTLESTNSSEHEPRLQVSLTIRKLTAFGKDGKPAYEQRTESRALQVPEEDSVVIPIFAASQREAEAFGVRELLLRFSTAGTRPRAEYGEIAVTADVPRAMIFLDGGLVGRTSSDAPFVLSSVRTGKREIAVMDPSGREARTVTQVDKRRRASVSLTLLPKSNSVGPTGLRPIGRNPQGAEEFWREKDGATVVRLPGFEFRMGSANAEGETNERPQHMVRVHDLLMDKMEVTWGQYKRFLAASSQPSPPSPVWGMLESFPASGITWDEAAAFCGWAGGRLPTEAEWERAARGNGSRQYPWGNTFDPWRCNTRDGGPHAPTPAGEYPDCISSFGILDLAGSVSEWCSDWFEDAYYAESPAENPTGPRTGNKRVSRGGGWMSPSQYTRAGARVGVDPSWHGPMQGFRCVQDDPKVGEK